MNKLITIVMIAITAMLSLTAEAKHHHGGPAPRRGGYYNCAPRHRPAHIIPGGGYSYAYYTECAPANFKVYTSPVVARRRYYTTTYTDPGVVTTTVVEAPPLTKYYQRTQCWQPGVTIVTPTTEVITPVEQVTRFITPVQTTFVAPQPQTIYVEKRPKLLDVGANVGVLGVNVGAGVSL